MTRDGRELSCTIEAEGPMKVLVMAPKQTVASGESSTYDQTVDELNLLLDEHLTRLNDLLVIEKLLSESRAGGNKRPTEPSSNAYNTQEGTQESKGESEKSEEKAEPDSPSTRKCPSNFHLLPILNRRRRRSASQSTVHGCTIGSH